MKTTLHILVVIVSGSLLGTFFEKLTFLFLGKESKIYSLIQTSINTGLNPTAIDLNVLQFTLGLTFKFNIATIVGIFFAAFIYKQIIK